MIDLSEVVGTVLQRVAKVLANHTVKIDLAPELPMVSLDFVLFEQVLFNLLDNAAKYAPPGSTIEIRARQQTDAIRIDVLDEGEGIPKDQFERIFDKFHRVHEGDRRRPGTGLGLAICRGFVTAMGGTIRASNRTDRSGADFVIEFPLPQGRAEAT
jgi:two-component system sensor histidine kinase KdpD